MAEDKILREELLTQIQHKLIEELHLRKQLEKNLVKLKEQAEQEVEARIAREQELNQAQQQLIESEKMAALGQLVAGVAHEINTPIGVCVTAASYLQRQVKQLQKSLEAGTLTKALLGEIAHSLEDSSLLILNNLDRASCLVSNFKEVAVEQSNEARQQFNVADNLEQIIISLNHSLKKNHCKIQVVCPPELTITSYPGRFMQIYSNLIINSLKHAFENWQGKRKIKIEIQQLGQTLNIDYKDSGKGIDPSISERIFDPFVTTKRGGDSSGLGTHIVYNLVVQLLKGSIHCKSKPGKGVHFQIILPYTP